MLVSVYDHINDYQSVKRLESAAVDFRTQRHMLMAGQNRPASFAQQIARKVTSC